MLQSTDFNIDQVCFALGSMDQNPPIIKPAKYNPCYEHPIICLTNATVNSTEAGYYLKVRTLGVCLFVLLLYVPSHGYGHGGTVSSPNHTFSWAGLNKQLTSTWYNSKLFGPLKRVCIS